ncbi:hypothetical protein [Rhizobium sp. BT-175]|uniref:hypothetical protein n=1 Tax=Rhizobium sp. BT-175 TaxID=2986929 RepID=UPI002235AFB1|nr:hypothetical protein [Rhizobium sp. BT-175]MCV9947505.1 hypothetical protein [Rhizobium sp. BT-175]
MKRFDSDYAKRGAEKRRLRIYATDPMTARRALYRIAIEIDNEPSLRPGPRGSIVEVHDFDGWNNQYYATVDLNDPTLLMEGGLAPSESDPRFHQQMVYAVSMKVVESARKALGRPITFYRSESRPILRLFPHAFFGRNAFFDPKLNAILFGYFRADPESPGPNIPNQTIFTCLSHDIIAHEMTHAIVHRLRPYFLEATNVDVLAFHEAFSDIIALLQRFSYRELLANHIQASEGKIHKSTMLLELAQQFGQATGTGKGLRTAIDEKPDPTKLAKTREPHARGAILLSAVFAGYLKAFQNRTADLFRLASGGTGILTAGRLHPDLVGRLTAEASQLSDRFLRICFRAFDYMPPVDVTFGDFLRAIVTSDFELNPSDPDEVRFEIVEAFRERGIYPSGVQSLAEEALLWPSAIGVMADPLSPDLLRMARELLNISGRTLDQSRSTRRRSVSEDAGPSSSRERIRHYESLVIESSDDQPDATAGHSDFQSGLYAALHNYATQNAAAFGLSQAIPIAVKGFHSIQRVASDQRLVIEFVAQFVQTDKEQSERWESGGLPFRAGATVIFGSEGEVRYIASKPMPSENLADALKDAAEARRRNTLDFVAELDDRDPRMAVADQVYLRDRMKLRAQFQALHVHR